MAECRKLYEKTVGMLREVWEASKAENEGRWGDFEKWMRHARDSLGDVQRLLSACMREEKK